MYIHDLPNKYKGFPWQTLNLPAGNYADMKKTSRNHADMKPVFHKAIQCQMHGILGGWVEVQLALAIAVLTKLTMRMVYSQYYF